MDNQQEQVLDSSREQKQQIYDYKLGKCNCSSIE